MPDDFSKNLTDRGKETPQKPDSPKAKLSGKQSGERLVAAMEENARIAREQQAKRDTTLDVDTDHLRDLGKHLKKEQENPSRDKTLDVDTDHLRGLIKHLDEKQGSSSS